MPSCRISVFNTTPATSTVMLQYSATSSTWYLCSQIGKVLSYLFLINLVALIAFYIAYNYIVVNYEAPDFSPGVIRVFNRRDAETRRDSRRTNQETDKKIPIVVLCVTLQILCASAVRLTFLRREVVMFYP